MKAVLLILALSLPLAAQKLPINKWVEYEAGDTETHFYNPARITRKKAIVSVWTQVTVNRTNEIRFLALNEFNCKAHTFRVPSGVKYEYGEAVPYNNPRVPFQPVVPDTIIEALAEIVCN